MAETLIANLINPQVMAAFFEAKLANAIKLAPLAVLDNTLQGQPGNTITVPKWAYIGAAEVVAEGAEITPALLSATSSEVTIQKIAKAVDLSDEALLSAYGDPTREIAFQLALSVADYIDGDLLGKLAAAPAGMTHTAGGAAPITADDVAEALTLYGEDIDGPKAYLCDPTSYAEIRKDSAWVGGSETGIANIISGTVGMIHGCQVVVSNRIGADAAYIVKPGALRIYLKRDTLLETGRPLTGFATTFKVSKHYAANLYDESKAIKIVAA